MKIKKIIGYILIAAFFGANAYYWIAYIPWYVMIAFIFITAGLILFSALLVWLFKDNDKTYGDE